MTATRIHDTVLSFRYPSERRARLVGDALAPEVGEIDDARSVATVSSDGDAVHVRIAADDLVALRAGINSWTRLVEVAERVGDRAGNRAGKRIDDRGGDETDSRGGDATGDRDGERTGTHRDRE
ncbi:hypothetical protein JCM31271_01070 [Halorubrum trueperi]